MKAWIVGITCVIAACDGGAENAVSSSSGTSASSSGLGGGGGQGGAGGGPVCDSTSPPAASSDWCQRTPSGPPGPGPVMVDLARAHAGVRFFAPLMQYADADAALVQALEAADADVKPDLAAYASALPLACAPLATPTRTLGAAEVTLDGDVARIHPGTGKVILPSGAAAVVVDLRGLPIDPALAQALEAAVSPALAKDIARPRRRVRSHDGMTDEVYSATNAYTNQAILQKAPPILATGAHDLPLVLLTEAVMPPQAVELAAALRLANRASIFGEDLSIEVAEARWAGVGAHGLAYRYEDLLAKGSTALPDVLPADRRATDPACLVTSAADVPTSPPALALAAAKRPLIKGVAPFKNIEMTPVDLGAARAALVEARGAAELFWPYPTAGLDARLDETIKSVGAAPKLDRKAVVDALHRFGAVLDDGHCFISNYQGSGAGYLLVVVDDINGEAVVRRSATAGINAGDTITSIAGVDAATWYATELARTSASTDGYRFNVASRRYMSLLGPTDFGLRDPDGNTKVVQAMPADAAATTAFGFAPSLRPAGFLADLGAPTLYYINLGEDVLADIGAFRAALTEAATATGLVVDMRGYPGVDHYEVARRLINAPFSSPKFHVPTFQGPDVATFNDSSIPLTPLSNPSFSGPIVLLVGHATVSAAENFSTMLVDAKRVTVVGRRSAGTNGNITGLQLPGGFAFSFTGMDVYHGDGSAFTGLGIAPAADVVLTAKAFRDGIDPELMDAIAALP